MLYQGYAELARAILRREAPPDPPPQPADDAGAIRAAGLAPNRVEFVRWLVRNARLGEGLEGGLFPPPNG